MMDSLPEGGGVDGFEGIVLADVFGCKNRVAEAVAFWGGALPGLIGLFEPGQQLRSTALKGFFLFFVVPSQDVTAGIASSGPIVFFVPVPVLDQSLHGDGFLISFKGLL